MVYHFNHSNHTIRKPRRYSHRPLRKVRIPPVRAPFLSSFWNRSFWHCWIVAKCVKCVECRSYAVRGQQLPLWCLQLLWCDAALMHCGILVPFDSLDFMSFRGILSVSTLLHNSLVSLHSRWTCFGSFACFGPVLGMLFSFFTCVDIFDVWQSEARGDLWHFLPRTLRWDCRHRQTSSNVAQKLHKSVAPVESNVVQDTYHWFVPTGQHGMMLGSIVTKCVTLQSKPYEGHEHFVDVDCTDVVTPKTSCRFKMSKSEVFRFFFRYLRFTHFFQHVSIRFDFYPEMQSQRVSSARVPATDLDTGDTGDTGTWKSRRRNHKSPLEGFGSSFALELL